MEGFCSFWAIIRIWWPTARVFAPNCLSIMPMITRRDFHKGLMGAALASLATPLGAATNAASRSRVILNRLTFGVTPASLAELNSAGLEAWLEDQLTRPAIDDPLRARLKDARLLINYEAGATAQGASWTALSEQRPYTYLDTDPKDLLKFLDFSQGFAWEERIRPTREVISASTIRATHATAQLREVITQFWHEHFSVNALKDEYTAIHFPRYDKTIRDHALGNFRDLLEAVATSPAMLNYLNNDASRASPANENYARELLELHTLGAGHYLNDLYDDWKAVPGALDGAAQGYIDQDVYEVARAFTGWSIGDGRYVEDGTYAPMTGEFEYIESWHDPYQKRILGVEFGPNAAKMEDGRRVLDMLAAHAGTAQFITGKLLARLGVEMPSKSYHAEIAEVFRATVQAPDQIAQVVRAIVLHAEFAQTPPSKLKRPFEFLVSMYRASGAEVSSPRYNVHWWLERAGWTQHRVRPPTGHSDRSADWANTRTLKSMVDLALFAHDDWFDVAHLDMAMAVEGAATWGDITAHWAERFGTGEAVGQAALEAIGADAGAGLPDDPDYVSWGNSTAITLSALTPEFMFR